MPKLPIVFLPVLLVALLPPAHAARTGEQIVQQQCVKCHEAGIDGAPRIGDREAWIPRIRQGLELTVQSAIRGHGKMPARGGMAELTDPEMRAAVVYMFNQEAGRAAGPAAKPQTPDPHRKVVGGTEILLGVIAADALRSRGGDAKMHGGVPRGKDYYHVNITLHDLQSKADIKDAQVEARVATPLRGETRKLEPMTVDQAVSYGSYFRMPGRDAYTITVLIRRPDRPQPIEATFDHRNY